MTIPVGALATLVGIATALAALAPVVLAVLWVRDWKRGRLW